MPAARDASMTVVRVLVEAVGVDVAVAVDESHRMVLGRQVPSSGGRRRRTSVSSRGNSGSGADPAVSSDAAAQDSASRIGGPPLPSAP